MSEFMEKLIAAGILEKNHEFTDDTSVLNTLRGHLESRLELEDKLKKIEEKSAAPPATTEPAATEPAVEPPKKKSAPTPAMASDIDPSQLDYSKWLQGNGSITRDPSGNFISETHPAQAELLNREAAARSEHQNRMLQRLSDPEKFTKEYLGDSLQNLIDAAVEKATTPLKQELQKTAKQFVKAPDARQAYFQKHQDDSDEVFVQRQAQFDEISNALAQQFRDEGILADADPEVFKEQVAALAATKTDLILLNTPKSAPPNEGQAAPPANDSTFVENVNSGADIDQSGTRNNGNTRQLNEHAQQVGDTSQPVTTQGRTDFTALANESAARQGIDI